jgi:hypothetical protein
MTAKILTFPRLLSANAPPVIEGEIVADPALTLDAPCDRPKRRKPRAKMRVEQAEVTCVRVPRKQHNDLRTLSGVLTLDFKGEIPWTATFDPDDENVPNIVAPIVGGGLKRSDDVIEIACDEGTWVFAPIEDDNEDDEE